MHTDLSVRELQFEDIDLIASYWLDSEPAFLVGMGVDLGKLPAKEDFIKMLTQQINTPLKEKASYALIWLENGIPVGHTNLNGIEFGNSAYMHLHL